jgi:hypothetical protein
MAPGKVRSPPTSLCMGSGRGSVHSEVGLSSAREGSEPSNLVVVRLGKRLGALESAYPLGWREAPTPPTSVGVASGKVHRTARRDRGGGGVGSHQCDLSIAARSRRLAALDTPTQSAKEKA